MNGVKIVFLNETESQNENGLFSERSVFFL